MKNHKTAKTFIKAFGLKRNYTLKDLTKILHKQGFTLYEYTSFSNDAERLFLKLDCLETATANYSFSVCSDDVNLCCLKAPLTEKEKRLLLLHENLHIFVGDVKKDCPISPFQEKTVTDLHFIVDFILNTRRYVRLTAVILATALLLGGIHHFTYSKSTEAYFYVTPSGTHYHKEDCDEIIKNERAYKISAGDALKSYLPCSKCTPKK